MDLRVPQHAPVVVEMLLEVLHDVSYRDGQPRTVAYGVRRVAERDHSEFGPAARARVAVPEQTS